MAIADDEKTKKEPMNEPAVMRQRLAELEAVKAENRRADEALNFLAHVGRALAASLDYDTTLQTTVRLSIPALADRVVVDVVEEKGQHLLFYPSRGRPLTGEQTLRQGGA